MMEQKEAGQWKCFCAAEDARRRRGTLVDLRFRIGGARPFGVHLALTPVPSEVERTLEARSSLLREGTADMPMIPKQFECSASCIVRYEVISCQGKTRVGYGAQRVCSEQEAERDMRQN